jgi:predicted dehydrogenase
MDGSNLRVMFLDGTEDAVAETIGSGSGSGFMAFSHGPHKAVITDFLDSIECGRDPAITGEEALTTQRVIDAIIAKGSM